LLWKIFIDPSWRDGSWWATFSLSLIVFTVAASAMGAGAFARERESRTWDGLRMSLLSRREIIAGQNDVASLACLLYSLPLWPVLGLCLLQNGITGFYPARGVTFLQASCSLLLLASMAWFCIVWGMFLSWRHRRIATSTACALATLFFAFVFMPAILLMLFPSGPVAGQTALQTFNTRQRFF
jgi:ABC-type transport system involved in multi-copper enzyme maturation permease subunit